MRPLVKSEGHGSDQRTPDDERDHLLPAAQAPEVDSNCKLDYETGSLSMEAKR